MTTLIPLHFALGGPRDRCQAQWRQASRKSWQALNCRGNTPFEPTQAQLEETEFTCGAGVNFTATDFTLR